MRLTDCFADLIGYVVSFRKTVGEKQPPYEEVRNEIVRLLTKSEDYPNKGLCKPEDFYEARYAICAWIDETILALPWNHRSNWRAERLQRVYYNSTDAGVRFFDKLNKLGTHQKALREVYYLCLALGFQGRYCGPEDEYTLEQLKEHQLKLIFDGSKESPSLSSIEQHRLFPDAYPAGDIFAQTEAKTARERRNFWLSVMGGPVALLFVLFAIYKFTLFTLGENILRALGQA